MKYTKYQYKKKNSGMKFLSSLVMTTLAAIAIGLFLAWILLKAIPNDAISEKTNAIPQTEEGNNSNIAEEQDIENFTLIQCGYFSNEANAKQVLDKIDSEFDSFIVKDSEGKYRVLAGITKEADSATIMNNLKEKGIDNIKVNLGLNKSNEVESQIIAITEGYLDILNTTGEEEVKEVNTNDFKDWTKNLEMISEGSSIEVLNEYKEHINGLPESINKSNIVSELEYIYSILSRIKK